MLRGAIIGVGNVALAGHLPAWLERTDVSLVAASDPSESGRERIESLVPGIRWHRSAAELLDTEDLDFVDIATPPVLHAEISRQALERGLHVLCEKPLVVRLDEMADLTRLASKADRVLHTVHNWSHAPILAKMRELVERGEAGDVRRCLWQTLRREPAGASGTDNWRVDTAISGGGILVDHGWHAFYVVCGWMPGAPLRVGASVERGNANVSSIEDTARVLLEYDRATAEILLTWTAGESANRAEVVGSRGVIRMEDSFLELSGGSLPRETQRWDFPRPLSEGSHHPDWFGGVIESFFDEIAGRRTRGSNLAEAALCARLVATSYESARQGGKAVPVSDTLALETKPF